MDHPVGLTGRLWIGVMVAVAALLLLAPASQAIEPPAEGYEQFAGCPSPDEELGIEACVTSTITGGHFQMGKKDVPINKPIIFSVGGTPEGKVLWNEKGGLLPTPLEVPGGLVGLTGLDWLVNFLGLEALKVYAVTELAGQPSNPFNLGEDFELPIKVHLINPVIGKKCYVGSNTEPIDLNLTFGKTEPLPPNEPIKGQFPKLEEGTLPGTLLFNDGIFVENEFAAPAAKGCRLELGLINISIDSLVNLTSGLPAAAGTNETIQEVDTEAAFYEFVYP
jgi:hypothetical protein